MSIRQSLAVVLIFGAIYLGVPGVSPQGLPAGQPLLSARTQPTPTPEIQDEREQLDAMKADLARMRAILGQMQNNIGFVGSTTTPLNHQFSLEIEMWQVLITQMERRVETLEKAKQRQH